MFVGDNIGSYNLRKILNSESKCTDKIASKHKHRFSVLAIAEVQQPNAVYYFDVVKCKDCNSFVGVHRKGAYDGFIGKFEDLSEEEKMRPCVKLIKTHKTIGYKGAELNLK